MAKNKLLSESAPAGVEIGAVSAKPQPDPVQEVVISGVGIGYAKPPPAQPRKSNDPRRFVMGDFQDMGLWLLGRLKQRYSHINDRMFMGWLRGAMESNEFLFLRTQNAAALAQAIHNPLSAAPIVEEVFVLARNNDIAEAAQLYQPMKRWAAGMGAAEFQIERFSDVPHEIVRDVIGGRIMVRERLFVSLSYS